MTSATRCVITRHESNHTNVISIFQMFFLLIHHVKTCFCGVALVHKSSFGSAELNTEHSIKALPLPGWGRASQCYEKDILIAFHLFIRIGNEEKQPRFEVFDRIKSQHWANYCIYDFNVTDGGIRRVSEWHF